MSGLVAAAALVAWGPAFADEPVVVQPTLAAQPDGDAFFKLAPPQALKAGVGGGKGEVDCLVRVDGALSDCKLVGETPVGLGYGEAALRATALIRMHPATRDGTPFEARVRLPIRWPSLIVNPSPLVTPSADQMIRLYPPQAQTGGRTVIGCKAGVDGLLHDCKVQSETPQGMGFGEASMRAAELYRVKPGTVDGKPVESPVVIPIIWRAPGAD